MLTACLSVGSPAYESIDVSITQLVQPSDYTCKPETLKERRRKRPMEIRYDYKVNKHGQQCLPLVLDITGDMHGPAQKFLKEASGQGGNSKIQFFRKECAAAICRMVGYLHNKNLSLRTQEIVTDVEVTEEMAAFEAENDEEKRFADEY